MVGRIEEEHAQLHLFAVGAALAEHLVERALGSLAGVHGEVAVIEDRVDVVEAADDMAAKGGVVDDAVGLTNLVEEREGVLLVLGIEGGQGDAGGDVGGWFGGQCSDLAISWGFGYCRESERDSEVRGVGELCEVGHRGEPLLNAGVRSRHG